MPISRQASKAGYNWTFKKFIRIKACEGKEGGC